MVFVVPQRLDIRGDMAYVGKFPYPGGALREQLYDWARRVSRWFEVWTDTAPSTTSISTVVKSTNIYSMTPWTESPLNNLRIIRASVAKNGVQDNNHRMFQLVWEFSTTFGGPRPAAFTLGLDLFFWFARSATPYHFRQFGFIYAADKTKLTSLSRATDYTNCKCHIFGPHGLYSTVTTSRP